MWRNYCTRDKCGCTNIDTDAYQLATHLAHGRLVKSAAIQATDCVGSTLYQFMGNKTVVLTSSLMIYIHRRDHFHGKVSSECPSRFDAAAGITQLLGLAWVVRPTAMDGTLYLQAGGTFFFFLGGGGGGGGGARCPVHAVIHLAIQQRSSWVAIEHRDLYNDITI